MATRIRTIPATSTSVELINTHGDWYSIKVRKQTTGTVVVGENQELIPTSTGRGTELSAEDWLDMILSPGTILYVASPTEERVTIIEQILPIKPVVDALERIAGAFDRLQKCE